MGPRLFSCDFLTFIQLLRINVVMPSPAKHISLLLFHILIYKLRGPLIPEFGLEISHDMFECDPEKLGRVNEVQAYW